MSFKKDKNKSLEWKLWLLNNRATLVEIGIPFDFVVQFSPFSTLCPPLSVLHSLSLPISPRYSLQTRCSRWDPLPLYIESFLSVPIHSNFSLSLCVATKLIFYFCTLRFVAFLMLFVYGRFAFNSLTF